MFFVIHPHVEPMAKVLKAFIFFYTFNRCVVNIYLRLELFGLGENFFECKLLTFV